MGHSFTFDTLHEGVALLLLRQPWMIFSVIAALFRGKAAFKAFIAQRAPLTCDKLPVNRPLHDLLTQEHAKGRRIALFSAADQSTVDRLCEAYPLFESGHGSDGHRNLSGKAKLAVIREKLGDEFVYAGNAPADFHVWRGSAAAIVVSPSIRFTRRVEKSLPVHHAFAASRRGIKTWLRALRVHQWAKNALVFVPALMSVPKLTPALMGEFLAGFAALCAVASAPPSSTTRSTSTVTGATIRSVTGRSPAAQSRCSKACSPQSSCWQSVWHSPGSCPR